MQDLHQIFNKLWEIYTKQNPAVERVYNLFVNEGEVVVNDHIAFRTFNLPQISIDVLSKPFINSGYFEAGEYHFPEKKLFAKHFEHPDFSFPRVFISELILEKFQPSFQKIVKKFVSEISKENLQSEKLIFSGRLWTQPFFHIYEKLRETSEYAAWLYVYGFCANHFTVSVNHLKKFDTIEKVNLLLKQNGFRLNDSGGEIKGSPEKLLEQSSIHAGNIDFEFVEDAVPIPGCYYEFAKRYPDSGGKLFSGFIAKSADKIFESTDKMEDYQFDD